MCLLQIAIEPKSKADNDKMGAALYKLAQEDPSFHFSRDDETNQTVIEGMGELHLDIIVDRMKREFNVAADIGAPQVRFTMRIGVRYIGIVLGLLVWMPVFVALHVLGNGDIRPDAILGQFLQWYEAPESRLLLLQVAEQI